MTRWDEWEVNAALREDQRRALPVPSLRYESLEQLRTSILKHLALILADDAAP